VKHLILSSLYNFDSGYKVILDYLLNGCLDNFILNKRCYSEISKEYEKYFEDLPPYQKCLELVLSPPCNGLGHNNFFYKLAPNKNRVLFTMWESTRIHDIFIEIANQQKALIVPNNWNKNNFIYQGLEIPIYVLPLFVDDVFTYSEKQDDDVFTFGTANGDYRKRINDVCNCFLKAFPNKKDVRLNVKLSSSDASIGSFLDTRINIVRKKLDLISLRDWYYSNDVFVSCVAAEGWGLMQHESMACGRSVIAAKYAGLEEFMSEDNSFCVDYSEVPSEGYWKNPGGKWSKYSEEHMIETMRYCYNNREEVRKKGFLASSQTKNLSKIKFKENLTHLICNFF
jgi:glycosyltransferase involved in cell wall biosynthesis